MDGKQVKVQFLGCGDAFGSGGRLQTCIMVSGANQRFLIDCGATSLSAIKHHQLDPSQIDLILISHLHGDHFGGLPFFLLDAHLVQSRRRPLLIAGPPGLENRTRDALEVFFPSSSRTRWRFDLEYVEIPDCVETTFGDMSVIAYPVVHASGATAYALRVRYGGKVLSFSGDTEWTDNLLEVARGADLLICESYFFDKRMPNHLDYSTLIRHYQQLDCRRIIVTHLSEELLGRLHDVELDVAEDGLVVTL